ncbi:hypothetical protein OKW30_006904 [Paraburkholderia sp. Clong3]
MTVWGDTHQRDGALSTSATAQAGANAAPAPDDDMTRAEAIARKLIGRSDSLGSHDAGED